MREDHQDLSFPLRIGERRRGKEKGRGIHPNQKTKENNKAKKGLEKRQPEPPSRPSQRLGVLLQLLYEPKIRFRSSPSGLDVLHRLRGRPPKFGDQVRRDDGRGPTDALDAVDEHARVRIHERPAHKGGRMWEVCGELAEGKVVERVLGAVEDGMLGGDGDEATHGGDDVGDAETGECGWVLCKGKVGDVETGDDFGGTRWTERVGRLGDGGGRPLGGSGGGSGDGHARGWWCSVTGGETEMGSL